MANMETAQKESRQPIRVIDTLQGQLQIRSADGSEITLEDCHTGSHYCTATARLQMAKKTQWEVPEIEAPQVQGRFSRNTEVCEGEPFGMLFYDPDHDRRVWINLGRVEKITVHPSSPSRSNAA